MNSNYLGGFLFVIGGICLFFVGMGVFNDTSIDFFGKKQRILAISNKTGLLGFFSAGIVTTAIIQSSDATTILALGLVDKGIIDQNKGLAIAFGSRLGTTVTALIVSFSNTNIAPIIFAVAMLFAVVLPKNQYNAKQIFKALGLIFAGLIILQHGCNQIQQILQIATTKTTNSMLLVLIGLVVTAIIQSSSAFASLLVMLISVGSMPIENAIFLYIGATVGTTITPFLAAIKMQRKAKNVALIYMVTAAIFALFALLPLQLFKSKLLEIIKKIPYTFQLSCFGIFYGLSSSVTCFALLVIYQSISIKPSKMVKPSS